MLLLSGAASNICNKKFLCNITRYFTPHVPFFSRLLIIKVFDSSHQSVSTLSNVDTALSARIEPVAGCSCSLWSALTPEGWSMESVTIPVAQMGVGELG